VVEACTRHVKGAAALRPERELGKGQMEGKSLTFHFKVLPRSVALLKSRNTRKNAVHNFTHDFHSRDTALFIALRYVGKPRRSRDRSTANQRARRRHSCCERMSYNAAAGRYTSRCIYKTLNKQLNEARCIPSDNAGNGRQGEHDQNTNKYTLCL